MKKNFINNWWLSLVAVFAISMWSCVDDEFDSPTPIPVPDPTHSIADVRAMFTSGTVILDEEIVIDGAVISSDILGNIFKTMYIQDETGSIALRTEVGNTSVDYPFGSEVVVRLNGTTLSVFAGLEQIGFASVNLREHIFRSQVSVPVTPVVKTISELSADDAPLLIQLEGVEFADQGATFADPAGGSGQNRTVVDCNGNEIIMRNSDFSDNAGSILPAGNGTMVALLGRFNNTPQLLLNFEEDLNLGSPLCGSGTGTEEFITITQLRSLFNGGTTTAPANSKVKAIVISDRTNGMITDRNVIVQEVGGSGITVRFPNNNTLNLNDEVDIVVSDGAMSEFNGLLQIEVDNAKATVVNSNVGITPQRITVAALLSDFENLESTLVEVISPTFSGNAVFNGNADVADVSGSIVMFTRGAADFANQPLPESADALTAIVTQGGGDAVMQIALRSFSDLVNPVGGNAGGPAEIPFNETFGAGLPFNWTTFAEVGDRLWEGRDFDGIFFARMSAFAGAGNPIAMTRTWLITPEFDMDAQSGEVLEFKVADAFKNGDPFKVMYSTNYSGMGDPTTATWTEIGSDVILPLINNTGTYDNMYESTGDIDISSVVGTAHIAFVYDSNNGTVSTNIDVSEVNIR